MFTWGLDPPVIAGGDCERWDRKKAATRIAGAEVRVMMNRANDEAGPHPHNVSPKGPVPKGGEPRTSKVLMLVRDGSTLHARRQSPHSTR
jgi:hypothetical protein